MTARADMFAIGSRLVGTAELPGGEDHPMIQWALMLSGFGSHASDETAWCSAFVNLLAYLTGSQRSHSAAARSWLKVGVDWPLMQAELGDVVVLKRGDGPQPGPEVLDAQGHVGLYAGAGDGPDGAGLVKLLGGNQHDQVSVSTFHVERILGIRRI